MSNPDDPRVVWRPVVEAKTATCGKPWVWLKLAGFYAAIALCFPTPLAVGSAVTLSMAAALRWAEWWKEQR